VLQVLAAVRANFVVTEACMAEEFLKNNNPATRRAFARAFAGVKLTHEPHVEFKRRVPAPSVSFVPAISVQYANMVLVSG